LVIERGGMRKSVDVRSYRKASDNEGERDDEQKRKMD
jgi:hypothetical protein